MSSNLDEVKSSEKLLIEKSLLEGVVSRAGTLFFTWSFISTLYGFISLGLFQKKIPELTLFDNVWPRVVFSSLPLLITAILYKKSNSYTKLKAYLTPFLLPLFLMVASLIKAWPLFWGGDYNFYLEFHATNIIAMSSGIFVISASPRLVFAQAVAFIAIYFGPLLFLFLKLHSPLANVIISDSLLVSIILMVTLKSIHKLRFSVAVGDMNRRRKASLFLGKKLTDAIYDSRKMKVEDYTREGLIMSIDLRGYTKFFQSFEPKVVRAFMDDYYSLVTKILSTKKSYLHKTIGDGLLISFGVMESDVDLSDLPEARKSEIDIQNQKKAFCLKQATDVFLEISLGLETISRQHGVSMLLAIGAGCAYGPIDVITRGDESYRQELDIQGSTIIKSVRLEAYSKVLISRIDGDSSFLLLTPELISFVAPEQKFKTMMITKKEDQVRDFPEISFLVYRQWKHNRSRSGIRAA